MAILYCPKCEAQRDARYLRMVPSIAHVYCRIYECTECGKLIEKPVGCWRRNRIRSKDKEYEKRTGTVMEF